MLEELEGINGLTAEEFCDKMLVAYQIAHTDVYRATTHNKGVMNGVAAVLLATGNDFRAAEAAAHAYAARDGKYRSLSKCKVVGDHFTVSLTIPLSVGTVGGITNIHPLARTSLEILGHPTAKELMKIIAAAGLASNFSALQNLVTQGIQKGHMKLHLANILNALCATLAERHAAQKYFTNHQVSYAAVKAFLDARNA
jgi:hydroxymethylglutaryl-CoA reductase